MVSRPRQGQAGQRKDSTPALGGLAAALAVIGALGVTGCTPQQPPATVTPSPTTSAASSTQSPSPSTSGSGVPAFPPIVRQFIDTVNAGNKAGANDLLCPRVLGISTPNIDKVTARKGKIGIDPDPRASDPGHAALVVTYGDATTATGTIEFAPYRDNGDLCISLFNVQD